MSCKTCKYFEFNQNDMMGACKLNPIVVNKVPQDWCGQEIPVIYEPTFMPHESVYDINTDQVKPKRGRKPNAGKQG
jgi:hypothetical protein